MKRRLGSQAFGYSLAMAIFDMQAYADYFAGKLEDRELDQKTLGAAFAELPRVAA